VAVMLIFLSLSVNAEEYKIKYGDTLYSLLIDKFTPVQINEINKKIKKLYPNFTLKYNDTVNIDNDSLTIKINVANQLIISKKDNSYDVKLKTFPVNSSMFIVTGIINTSLIEAVLKVGEKEELAYEIANILEWEINFFKDIRKGDSFKILLEKKFCDGKFLGYGKIYAIDFVNNGRAVRALRFEDGKYVGYYSPDGKSMKKGFLKAPLKYSRISSRYTHSRLHPVLHIRRPHHGVDYAAPRGTPVHATADGKIIERRYSKSAGNYVKIRHSNGYVTIYMHFSRFRKGQYVGKHVSQGEVIGYVGSTGYATGPHVDYRIKKFGKYLNPLTFKSPSKRLSKSKIAYFKKQTKKYLDLMNSSYEVIVYNNIGNTKK
jgi:murein DD-endopeptidase MepM/ murein hydrolase activator NlpD